MEHERMSTKEAADILGITPQYLRDLMESGKIDIGWVNHGKANQYGTCRNTYHIYRSKVAKLIGAEL